MSDRIFMAGRQHSGTDASREEPILSHREVHLMMEGLSTPPLTCPRCGAALVGARFPSVHDRDRVLKMVRDQPMMAVAELCAVSGCAPEQAAVWFKHYGPTPSCIATPPQRTQPPPIPPAPAQASDVCTHDWEVFASYREETQYRCRFCGAQSF